MSFIEITVIALCLSDDIYDFIHLLFKFRILLQCEQIRGTFHYLEKV